MVTEHVLRVMMSDRVLVALTDRCVRPAFICFSETITFIYPANNTRYVLV